MEAASSSQATEHAITLAGLKQQFDERMGESALAVCVLQTQLGVAQHTLASLEQTCAAKDAKLAQVWCDCREPVQHAYVCNVMHTQASTIHAELEHRINTLESTSREAQETIESLRHQLAQHQTAVCVVIMHEENIR